MTLTPIKTQIWEQSGKSLPLVDQARSLVIGDPETLHYWECVMRELTELMKPRKRRRASTYTVPQWVKDRYLRAYHEYQARNFKEWVKDGHTLDPRPIACDTNGLSVFAVNFLTWNGHFANRTGNQGTAIEKDGEIIRIPSSSKNGMQDIDINLKHPAHPYGIPWKIEVKWDKDVHKNHQKDFGKKVSATGGVYSVVRNHEDVINQYDALMVEQKVLF